MASIDTICSAVLGEAINWLKQEVDYLFNYERHVEDQRKKIDGLRDVRVELQQQVGCEERKGKGITDRVQHWLQNVNKIIEEAEKKSADQMNPSCCRGLFPNPWSRYILGKQAHETAQEVEEVLKNKPDMAFVGWQGPMPTEATLSTVDHESFGSRKEAIDKLREKLKDSSVGKIGVCGPSGVGKTTLVKNIAREFQDKFKVVVFASVRRNPDVKKIQGAIADVLGLRLDEKSETGRAERILERFNKEKENTLIILDDLWVELDLNRLGIPIAGRGFNYKMSMKTEGMPNLDYDMTREKEESLAEQRMFKILLTSRSKDALFKMGVDEKSMISIGLLNEEEAETLLKKVAEVTDESPDIEPLVAKIAKKCQGLPIAISTIGKTLRGKPPDVWHSASQQLERIGFTGVNGDLKLSTMVSFDFLESEELKSTFLLCAQMGSDSLNADLMKHCYGLSVLQGVHTMKEAQDRTNTLIEKLKDLSLLIDGTSTDRFNMHDMVRDAALSISKKDEKFFTRRDEKLDEWPDKSELKRFSFISLCKCHINDDLPKNITFPLLKFFQINSGNPFVKIPNNFKGVTKLKVLILTDIPLPHLPFSNESIANSLRMLCLEQCLLTNTDNLSTIGELKKLRVLSFSGSLIEKLPSELGKLSNLQWFDISHCSQLRVIPPDVLSRLNALEVLYMRDSPIQWGSKAQANCEIQNATLAELSPLRQLTNLDACIPDAAVFPKNLFLDELDSYKIVIGDPKLLSEGDFTMPKKYEASRALVLQLKEDLNIHTYEGIKMLVRRAEKLYLGELHGIENVFYELNWEGFKSLQHFSIQNNSDIECIIDLKMSYPLDAFPNLESLCLYELKNLRTICHSNLTGSSFGKLKSIKIKGCSQLKSIFPVSVVSLLKRLETFEVSNCPSLKEIVAGEENTSNNGEVGSKIEFTQLRFLTLQSLPAFTSFYSSGVNISPSMIFSEKINFLQLETLELSAINNQIQTLWSDQTASSSCLRNLVKLEVDGCNGLTYLFSFSEAKNLENLKTISVSGCDKMEKIFLQEEISIEEKVCIFPNLGEINLTNMRSLSAIWHPPEVSVDPYPTLSSVIIEKCEALVTVFPHHMVGHFPRLENLKISGCSSVKEIFDLNDAPQNNEPGNETNLRSVIIDKLPKLKHVWNRDPKGILSFKNMQKIWIRFCNNLENLFPPSFAKGLENLDGLYISFCRELIAWNKGPETSDISFDFPLLKKLVVCYCDKLVVFPIPTESKHQDNQPISILEKVISNLEITGLGHKEAEWLQHYVDRHVMHQLKGLHFFQLQSNDFLYKILHRIPNLEKLSFHFCSLRELFSSGSLVAEEKIGTVVQIKELTLQSMTFLEIIGFEHDPVLQRVERLSINSCDYLISLLPCTVSFTRLKSLEVSKCIKLLSLMGTSTAKSLVQLTTMKVTGCSAIEIIVAKERNEEGKVDEHGIVFRKLMTLELESLENLTSFCNSKNHNLNFPVLENLTVRHCPNMKIFSKGLTIAPILKQVSLEDGVRWLWERDLNAAIRGELTDMVFSTYRHLELSQYSLLERVWLGQVSPLDNYFCNLESLEVTNCDFLSSAIPFHLLAYLNNLKQLQVSNCNAVAVIFDMNDTKMIKTGGKALSLETLRLYNLPNLKQVWNKDPQGLIIFYNLQDVSVEGCKRLKTLFPKSVAKILPELGSLSIHNCGALEEIVGNEDAAAGGDTDEMCEFSCLAILRLSMLPELKCFYRGRFNLKCAMLEELYVYQCGKFEIFTSESQSCKEAVPHRQIISVEGRSLFSAQEVLPLLRRVTLNEKHIKMIFRGGFQEKLQKLKDLRLQCFHNVNETDHLPFEILDKVPNLETLIVACSGFKQIFFSQILDDYHVTRPAKLKKLELHDLPRLDSIGSQHFSTDPVLDNLEVLEVDRCSSLTELIQSSVAFSNLKQLNIVNCDGMVYLFTTSTARSLVQLQTIRIHECESIKEVVAEDRNESDSSDEIMFEKLSGIDLDFLPSLVNFYSGSSTLKFPYLDDVSIGRCPRMKTFCNGIVDAPLLPLIMDGLNLIVHKISNGKLHFANMHNLKLSKYPELHKLWLGETPLPAYWFSRLTTLVVENCEFLSDVIPSNFLPCFTKLKELQVRNCSSVKVIFDINGIEMSKIEEKAFRLEKLILDQLPHLEFVWNNNPKRIMSFEKLQKVKVRDCESLQYLFPAASMAKHLLKLKVQNCGALLQVLRKEDTASEASETLEFPCLTTVILNHLPELNRFYSGRLKCPVLKVLNVYHCGKLEVFTSENKGNQALPEDQVGVSINAPPVFLVEEVSPKLEEASLNEKETMALWHEELQANFLSSIKSLQLYCFHNVTDLEDILQHGFLHRVPNVEILAVACSDFREIFPSKGVKEEYIRMLAQLKGLRLEALPKLNSIGLEHSSLVLFNGNLESLEIRSCSALTNIVQSAVSFSLLKELSVTKCHKLVFLFPSSTAKSLVQLRKMSIENCKSMREIVAKDDEESTEDEIVFGELTKLFLNDLPSLGCFYAGNSTLRFPYLQEVIIVQCSKMKVFSQGLVSAPQLPAIKVSLEKWHVRWEGDLNSTVKKLFKGKEVIADH